MRHSLVPLLALAALAAACAHSDAAGHSADTAAQASATATAAGTLAAGRLAAGGVAAEGAAAGGDSATQAAADRGRILGDSSATLWVVMASDFQCPFCKEWHDAQFAKVLAGYVKTGKIRLAFLNMPLSIHPNAVPAAEAAMCASAQNKFWPMHDSLFASQPRWAERPSPGPVFDSLATKIGVNMAAWRACVSQHATLALIQADHDRAASSGVHSTPTFFVGSHALMGADADVPGAIDAALGKGRSGAP